MQNFKKKYACLRSCCWCKKQGPLLEISYIPLLSVMTTLQYHRISSLSSISSLEVNNLSLEDMKQLCRQKPPSHRYKYTYPKTNN